MCSKTMKHGQQRLLEIDTSSSITFFFTAMITFHLKANGTVKCNAAAWTEIFSKAIWNHVCSS